MNKNFIQYLILILSIFTIESKAQIEKKTNFNSLKSNELAIVSIPFLNSLQKPETNQVQPQIYSDNPVICEKNRSSKLYTEKIEYAEYVWYFSSGGAFEILKNQSTHEIITDKIGYYFVIIKTANGARQSGYFIVSNNSLLIIKDMEDNPVNTLYVKPGEPFSFKVYHYGSDVISMNNSKKISTKIAAYENPQIITITQNENTFFNLLMSPSACGDQTYAFPLSIIVDSTTSFSFEKSNNLDACAGETLKLPIKRKGIWGNDISLIFDLVSPEGNRIDESRVSLINSDTLNLNINANLTVGTKFKIALRESFSPRIPYSKIVSDDIFTITSRGCKSSAFIEYTTSDLCSPVYVNAYPSENGYKFEWYKNENLEKTSFDNNVFYIDSEGEYYVVISGPDGYYSKSSVTKFKINNTHASIISEPTSNICGGETIKTFSFANNPSISSVQWFHQIANNESFPLKNANSNIITVNQQGEYYFSYKKGDCWVFSPSFYTCNLLISGKTEQLCPNSSVSVSYITYPPNYSNYLNLYLESYQFNAKTYLLKSLKYNNFYGKIEAVIPDSIPSGQYRYKIIETSEDGSILSTSAFSSEILTLMNGKADPPKISAEKLSICENEIIEINSSNCVGETIWNSNFVGPKLELKLLQTANFTAVCSIPGCENSINSNTLNIDVYPKPTISISSNIPVYFGQELKLEAKGASIFNWTGPDNFKSNLSEISILNLNPNNSGTYYVTATSDKGCSNSSSLTISINELLGIPSESSEIVTIYPNPSSEFINIKVKNEISNIDIIKLDGSYIKSVNTNKVTISDLTSGRYYLIIKTKQKTTIKQFIKI